MNLRQITHKDQLILKQVYFDSINSIDENIYTKEQKFVWASQAWDNVEVDKSLLQGKGWILSKRGEIIGFATRYPDDRLSLFYVRGSSRRKGYGNLILEKVEKEALKTGIKQLKTEASLISFKMLLKRNWEIREKEEVAIKGLLFKRYKMIKIL